jgi:hypothetical protein
MVPPNVVSPTRRSKNLPRSPEPSRSVQSSLKLDSFPDCLNKVIAMSLNVLEIYLTKSRKIIVHGDDKQPASSAALTTFNRNLISLGFVCSQELTGALAGGMDLGGQRRDGPSAGPRLGGGQEG